MIGYLVLGLLLLFAAVLLLRAAAFRPKGKKLPPAEPVAFDEAAAVHALAELVKCKTVSYNDPAMENDGEFDKLLAKLHDLYPRVFDVCSLRQLPGRALLFRWHGRQNGAPAVLMAHFDVVPADDAQWDRPPFAAEIADGVMWGRGTVDTKATLNGILSAANTLIAGGFCPENDVYFAFSGGEEINGRGAPNIVAYFREHGITPALVLDEGGAVVEHVFPGVEKPCGLIGVAEKGMVNVSYRACSQGGHASAPKPGSPAVLLSQVCTRIEGHPFPAHLRGPARDMFDTLGRHASFGYRVIFANLWCFGWLLDLLARKNGGEMNALLRTTVAFTQLEGSKARNVIPPEASMVTNIRINPADSVDGVLKRLATLVGDRPVTITNLESFEPSPVSETDGPAWQKVTAAVSGTWPECIVSPYLMVQCSDSRHYGAISNHVYRFSAMDLTAQERAGIHGNNEHIRLEAACRAVAFYIRLLRQL